MVATGEPAMYCDDWLMKSESLPCGSMSSQKISMLLSSMNACRFMKGGGRLGAS